MYAWCSCEGDTNIMTSILKMRKLRFREEKCLISYRILTPNPRS